MKVLLAGVALTVTLAFFLTDAHAQLTLNPQLGVKNAQGQDWAFQFVGFTVSQGPYDYQCGYVGFAATIGNDVTFQSAEAGSTLDGTFKDINKTQTLYALDKDVGAQTDACPKWGPLPKPGYGVKFDTLPNIDDYLIGRHCWPGGYYNTIRYSGNSSSNTIIKSFDFLPEIGTPINRGPAGTVIIVFRNKSNVPTSREFSLKNLILIILGNCGVTLVLFNLVRRSYAVRSGSSLAIILLKIPVLVSRLL